MIKISAIIPTFNRFKFLLHTIKSIKEQTYKNIEIIVINDCSTQEEYYNHDWLGIKIIHLKENSKKKFGYACAGYVRNQGIKEATGKYVAFCDDDDYWLPHKIEMQLEAIKKTGCKMSSTEGFCGKGLYDKNKKYIKYLKTIHYETVKRKYKNTIFFIFFKRKKDYPDIWNYSFIKIHNCIICSSVLIKKDILNEINNMNNLKNGKEDYDCWLRALKKTNCVYIKNPCVYYDGGHGNGRKY
jgi:teichuronic acid biosynthesis glycosyltransferase TuaG